MGVIEEKRETEKRCLEEVDGLVFSGDYLVQPENRAKFQEYLDRWKRGLDSMAETFPEGSMEEDEEEDLNDGDDLICPICNGLGEDPRTDKICTSCHGQGWKEGHVEDE